MAACQRGFFLPVLEVGEFVVDLVDVDLVPADVVVAVDAQHDGVVEAVELLQQCQLLAIGVQRRVIGRRQPEQHLAARVRVEPTPHVVELRLYDVRSPRPHLIITVSPCSATYVRRQRGTARIRPPLLQRSIDVSCPPGPQQQTCSSGFAAVGPCWDRQTDAVPIHHKTPVPRGFEAQ